MCVTERLCQPRTTNMSSVFPTDDAAIIARLFLVKFTLCQYSDTVIFDTANRVRPR